MAELRGVEVDVQALGGLQEGRAPSKMVLVIGTAFGDCEGSVSERWASLMSVKSALAV